MNFRICGIGLTGAMLAGLALPAWAETSPTTPPKTGSPQAVASERARSIANEVHIDGARNVTVERSDPPPYGAGYKQRQQWWLQANQLPTAAVPPSGGASTSSPDAGATNGSRGNNGSAGAGNSGKSGSPGSGNGR